MTGNLAWDPEVVYCDEDEYVHTHTHTHTYIYIYIQIIMSNVILVDD